jgi:hypothetical protein
VNAVNGDPRATEPSGEFIGEEDIPYLRGAVRVELAVVFLSLKVVQE